MKKKSENIYIFDLSKIFSQQNLIMNAWKDDKDHSTEEKGNSIVNFVKNITALSKGKSSNLVAAFNNILASLNNVIIGK